MRKSALVLILMLVLVCTSFQYVFANQAESVKQQIEDVNSQIKKLDAEIALYQQQLKNTSSEASSLSGLIKELILTRDKLVKETKQTEKKIGVTNLIISSLSEEISDSQKSINKSKVAISKMIRELYQYDSQLVLEKVLSSKDLSEASQEYNNIIYLNKDIKQKINDLKNKQELLNKSKNKKETEQKKLTELKKTLQQKKTSVDITKKEKDALLAETKNKESNYKKILAEKEKKRDEFEKAIEQYEAQLKFILNPNSLPDEGSGVLAWPIDNVYITSLFGPRWGRFHYGLDFRASVGTPVKAMSPGKVLGTGDTDIACKGASFGKWIFIKYDNGLSSTYGHLSSISTATGNVVKTGDIVGYSGNTGSSTGQHLHISVYASDGVKIETVPSKSCGGKIFTQPIAALNAYLNPIKYLPKATISMMKKGL